MTFKKKFVDQNGVTFSVEEVVQGPAGLMVYYIRENDGVKFTCLLDAFSERFEELVQ